MRGSAIDLEQLAATLPDAAARIRQFILAASGEDMELILRALDIRVMASRDRVHIDGTVPALTSQDPGAPAQDLVTIVQTSGCSRVDAKSTEPKFVWVLGRTL